MESVNSFQPTDQSADERRDFSLSEGTLRLPAWLLVLIILLPSIETCVAVTVKFYPSISYPVLKGLSLIAPLILWRLRRWPFAEIRRRLGLVKTRGLWGVGTGAVIFGGIVAVYYTLIGPRLDPTPVLRQAEALHLDTPLMYWSMAVFISLANSAYEEYFFRGFVLDELRMRMRPLFVVLLGAFLFGLHHIFALFPMFPPALASLFTVGTMAGGLIWSAMRMRGVSLWDCYISHIFADMAVFLLGWDLLVRAGAV